jgi:cytochrome c peroxidase
MDRGRTKTLAYALDHSFMGLATVWSRSPGDANDRYRFRTSPLRNVPLQPTFFHNGAFTRLEDAIRHHLDVLSSVNSYNLWTSFLAIGWVQQ